MASRNPGPSTSAQCAKAQIAEASGRRQHRSNAVCRALSLPPKGLARGKSSCCVGIARVPGILALQVTVVRRPAKGARRHLQLTREMRVANSLWSALRIHGELLKLGIDVGQTTVAKYMAKRKPPPSQGWKTFLRKHADAVASIDMLVVPTISFWLCMDCLCCGIHGGKFCGWGDRAPECRMDCPSTSRSLQLEVHCRI